MQTEKLVTFCSLKAPELKVLVYGGKHVIDVTTNSPVQLIPPMFASFKHGVFITSDQFTIRKLCEKLFDDPNRAQMVPTFMLHPEANWVLDEYKSYPKDPTGDNIMQMPQAPQQNAGAFEAVMSLQKMVLDLTARLEKYEGNGAQTTARPASGAKKPVSRGGKVTKPASVQAESSEVDETDES